MWLWAPINWQDCATFYHLNDDELGRPWNTHGVFVPLGEAGDPMGRVSSDLTFIPGTRHAAKAVLHFSGRSGGESEIVMTPRSHWYMKGVGYGHPEFSHGSYHGEFDMTYEEYALAEVDDAANLLVHVGDYGVVDGKVLSHNLWSARPRQQLLVSAIEVAVVERMFGKKVLR